MFLGETETVAPVHAIATLGSWQYRILNERLVVLPDIDRNVSNLPGDHAHS